MSFFGPDPIEKAVEVLASGGIIAYPTDTLYGVGADITNKQSINKVYLAKERDYSKPLSVAVADFKSIYRLAEVTNQHKEILENYLPGPYTFLLPSKRIALDIITCGSDKIGVRYPDHKLALQIISRLGHPITSTSANYSGEEPPSQFNQINIEVDYVVKGKCNHNQGSTIIDLTTNEVVRQGVGYNEIIKGLN
jgi:L-threonylcarbamoyladenylate synthase